MKLREYDIAIFNLSEKKHRYDFKISDSFFESFESELVEKGKADVLVNLEKSTRHIQMDFSISGSVELSCDRSLDTFDYPVSLEETIIFKYADTFEEIDENLINIPFDYQKINVAQYIYDFISLSIPMKRLHPRFEDTDEELTVFSTKREGEEEQQEEGSIDPRWKELEKLIDKNK